MMIKKLDTYEQVSGQMVTNKKSTFLISANIPAPTPSSLLIIWNALFIGEERKLSTLVVWSPKSSMLLKDGWVICSLWVAKFFLLDQCCTRCPYISSLWLTY